MFVGVVKFSYRLRSILVKSVCVWPRIVLVFSLVYHVFFLSQSQAAYAEMGCSIRVSGVGHDHCSTHSPCVPVLGLILLCVRSARRG